MAEKKIRLLSRLFTLSLCFFSLPLSQPIRFFFSTKGASTTRWRCTSLTS